MKKIFHKLTLATITIMLTGVPHTSVVAGTKQEYPNPLLITEVLPGAEQSASQEFIEIYNQSADTIDLAAQKWEVHITSSKAVSWDKAKVVALTGKVHPGGYILLTSTYTAPGESEGYLQAHSSGLFAPGITGNSGHIRIGHDSNSDTFYNSDVVEWTTQAGGVSVSPGIDSDPIINDKPIPNGSSIKRIAAEGVFTERKYGISSCPSPTALNKVPDSPAQEAPISTNIDIDNPLCIETETEPEPEEGGEVLPPSYTPPATLLPTEVKTNAVAKTPVMPASNKGLRAPQITEVLPNPASPQTDAADEFIELYNENAAPFDLSGSQVVVGLTGSKKYTFPAGTILPGRQFKAFFSSDTKASLSNSGGQVALMSPEGDLLHKSDAYGTAKDGMAWAANQKTWQWTTKPTPNLPNVIAAPAVSTAKRPAKSSAAVTGSTAKNTTAHSQPQMAAAAAEAKPERPIHPMALAAVGVFAVLYGAYEYRRDLANKFFQLRSYRTARREARQEPEGQ